MTIPKSILAQYMAFLISIPPKSNLAKLLKFCLVTNLNSKNTGKDSLEMSQQLLKNPNDLAYWIQEIMNSDFEYSPEELAAFADMELKNTEDFMKTLEQELENTNLSNYFFAASDD